MNEATDSVRDMVTWLIESAGMAPKAIAEALDNRVSGRTIYRWGNGESQPGNSSDFDELVALYQLKQKETA